jgi:hypothetical protein
MTNKEPRSTTTRQVKHSLKTRHDQSYKRRALSPHVTSLHMSTWTCNHCGLLHLLVAFRLVLRGTSLWHSRQPLAQDYLLLLHTQKLITHQHLRTLVPPPRGLHSQVQCMHAIHAFFVRRLDCLIARTPSFLSCRASRAPIEVHSPVNVCIHIHTCTRTHNTIQACIHAYMHALRFAKYMHVYMFIYVYTYMHTYIRGSKLHCVVCAARILIAAVILAA